MNLLDKLTDKEFIPFLQNLGVDTRNQSFEWMLNNPEFAPALEWIYYNLDLNNVLTLREKRRYAEIEKDNKQLDKEVSSKELEETIDVIKEQYPGICLPGENEKIDNAKYDIKVMKEKLNLLEKQDVIVRDLIKQNEINNDKLNVEITKINAAQQQALEEENVVADNCVKLAQEIDDLTDEMISVVSHNLDIYKSCGDNKESSQKFFVFGPFDQYKQSQDLFQSHFDLYTAKKFHNKPHDISDDNSVLYEAKSIEARLSKAMSVYIETKAELSSEQSKLQLVTNYEHPHCSQLGINIMEAQTAVQLLEQEESILEEQLQNAIKEFVEERTSVIEFMAIKASLDISQEIHNDLMFLLETTQQAFSLDKILYSALKHELYNIEEFLQFASQLRQYVIAENDAVESRIDSMKEICSEQEICEENHHTSDVLLKCLHGLLNVQMSNNSCELVKHFHELKLYIRELKDNVAKGYVKKEESLLKFKDSMKPLMDYIWDGCTKQPNCADRTVAALTHTLRQEMNKIDERILEASAKYNSVKNGDKRHMRKLWQWFLTDPPKLFAAMKAAQSGKFSVQ